jgi:glycosyltransferase 2 family protein
MRAVKTLLLILGAALLVFLVSRVGVAPILEALHRLTWWQFILVCLPYALSTALDTLGWRFAFAHDRAPFWRLYGARLAGESLNLVTAIGPVAGEAAKTWLVRRDVSYEESVPSVVIAKTTITIAQALFLLIGLVLAWSTLPLGSDLLRGMLWLLAMEILGVGGFVWVQVTGLVGRAGRLLRLIGVLTDTGYAETLDRALRDYYGRQWRRCGLSLGFHFLGWLVAPIETVIILWALGVDASIVTAIVIEALASGVRFATFMVPASLGAFEAANAAAFAALGFGAGAGLAFSFIRRARQAVWIAIGIVVLMAMRWKSGTIEERIARQETAGS